MIDLLFGHPIALVALVVGYVLLVVEMCIPGFGVPGIAGIILAVLGVVTMQPTPLQALIVVVVYVVLVVALRAFSREDLSLMPKGDKIARLLRM